MVAVRLPAIGGPPHELGVNGATLLTAGAVVFACFLVGCPGAVGGVGSPGGLTRNCTTLAQEAADIAQEGFANPSDTNLQCRILANQIAVIDAGCFGALPTTGGLSTADLRTSAVEQQQQLGCN